MIRYIASAAMALVLPVFAQAEPTLKIINFTAEWCPNCQVLNPRMDEAIEAFEPGMVERIDLDMTNNSRSSNLADKANAIKAAQDTAMAHDVYYLWDWYAGVTGIAVIVAADTGEPISCMLRTLSVDEIEGRLNLAKKLVENAPPAARKPQGPDCPPPTNS